jgi:HPr kinase/phosphorylase
VLLHATCVRLHGRGVLIRGVSGTGKSLLAAELIRRGAWLVGDDAVRLERLDGRILAHRPAGIGGHLEMRHLGLAVIPSLACTTVHLVVMLTRTVTIERLPSPASTGILGVVLPLIHIAPDAVPRAGTLVSASLARLVREVP